MVGTVALHLPPIVNRSEGGNSHPYTVINEGSARHSRPNALLSRTSKHGLSAFSNDCSFPSLPLARHFSRDAAHCECRHFP